MSPRFVIHSFSIQRTAAKLQSHSYEGSYEYGLRTNTHTNTHTHVFISHPFSIFPQGGGGMIIKFSHLTHTLLAHFHFCCTKQSFLPRLPVLCSEAHCQS